MNILIYTEFLFKLKTKANIIYNKIKFIMKSNDFTLEVRYDNGSEFRIKLIIGYLKEDNIKRILRKSSNPNSPKICYSAYMKKIKIFLI